MDTVTQLLLKFTKYKKRKENIFSKRFRDDFWILIKKSDQRIIMEKLKFIENAPAKK